MTRVFVNGTFDVLHPGHVALLRHAADLGHYLMVAIDSDRRVRELKGADRPFFSQADRKFMIESIAGVDEVVTFDTDQDLEAIICEYVPDIMVKGSDYENQHIIGAEHCGRVEFFERIYEYSSSKAIQHLTTR
jgi:D-beta-D-heptose 7-phosphate kinase/D-beta-D-heptose 1-phosphate adenosyltransferase